MPTSFLALGLVLAPSTAWAQVWVSPRRAGQTIVRYADHDWLTVELLVDEPIGGNEAGGVRLFFYESERAAAERAAAHLEDAYRQLSAAFDFVPPKRFDYVVYGTYQEFLRTNLFPVQEGVLGATAPRGLEVALPYFGDHAAFWHTATHELAHEFTIQKVRAARGADDVWGDPVEVLPLWFIEGLAEFVALGPIGGESSMRVRDLVANPDLYAGYGLLGFWDDWPGYVLWTYAGGHARITFLEETYGEGTVQRVLQLAPAVLSNVGPASRITGFDKLLEHITKDDKPRIAARFDAWIKRRAFQEVIDAGQSFADTDPLDAVVGVPLALDATSDGSLLAYRAISTDSGRTGLYVVDPRRAVATKRIAADSRPGTESLHPIDPRNFDLEGDRLVYVVESHGHDVLVIQELRHSAEERTGPSPEELREGTSAAPDTFDLPDVAKEQTWWRIRIRKGRTERIGLYEHGILAATSVAQEPGGARIALVGLGEDGVRDLWIVDPHGGIRRRTRDVAAERDVAWGHDGIVFSSDASADGRTQIFRVDPDGDSPPVRITTADRDHHSPVPIEGGPIVYSAYEEGSSQLYAHQGGQSVRLTDLPTGAFDPQPGPDGGLWALVQHAGRLRPILLEADAMQLSDGSGELGAAGPPVQLPTRSLSDASRYRPLDPRNWGIDGGFAALGAGAGGVYGQLYLSASDRLRDHAVVLAAQAYGSLELTDAQLLYLNQHGRITWGAGPFHGLRFRVDSSIDTDLLFQSGERFYGGLASARYPLDRYVYLQLDQALGGVSYFLFDWDEELLADPELNGAGRDLLPEWEAANPFPRWQSESTLRVGLDTTRYHPKTGPVAGLTALFEATYGVQPFDEQQYGSLRLDVQQYLPVPLIAGGNLGLRASGATSGLGGYARGYWLSSYDTLRAYTWGDPDLLGRHYWFSNAELQLPLDALLRFALASSVEGVAGLDFGGVSDELDQLWERRVLDGALGSNFILGPLVLRLHFARAIDIGAPLPQSNSPWVTNFSISWLNL
ncbi:MAG TPA: tolB protein precursor protein [Deltaproteobacteria bacterium]|nr:tolB protein precursor protein [Deltaproteobacteria bacterium]